MYWKYILLAAACAMRVWGDGMCEFSAPAAEWGIPHRPGEPEVVADAGAPVWNGAARADVGRDCRTAEEEGGRRTVVRGFWTDTDVYLLFECPYAALNLWLPAMGGGPRDKLWERDVVEMFLGSDWTDIRRYREFEIAPTGDWIDLAIDLDRDSYDRKWRSGWKTAARIDREKKVWYAAARIPLSAVDTGAVRSGTRWRVNLYRIEGAGEDAGRRFLCWQATCPRDRDPNHVPEHFGTMVFMP